MTVEQRFTDLPATSAAQLTDIICAVQGYVSPSVLGTSVQQTLQQIYNLFQTNLILFHAGNPNGTVAGTTYQLCWDTSDKILWVCTTTGIAGVALWTPCFGNLTDGQIIVGSTAGVPAPHKLRWRHAHLCASS